MIDTSPLQEGRTAHKIVLRLPVLVVVKSHSLRVTAKSCTQTQLHYPLVVGHLVVLGAHRGQVDLVGHLTEVLDEERERDLTHTLSLLLFPSPFLPRSLLTCIILSWSRASFERCSLLKAKRLWHPFPIHLLSHSMSFPLSLLSPSSPSFNPNLKRIPQHVHLVKLALQSNSHAQQLLSLGCRGVVVAEQSGCGLAETSAERVGESAVSCMSLQEPGDEGRGQLRVKVAGFNWNTH